MISKYRTQFNSEFTTEKYQNFKNDMASDFDYEPSFRMAETPFFISKELKAQVTQGANEVISFIKKNDFKEITSKALALNKTIPNEDNHTHFLAIDFGICEENGVIIPKLIEVQGFPSLFNFLNNNYKKLVNQYPFLKDFTPFFNNISEEVYLKTLEEIICHNHPKENVVLLEIEPEKQNTKIDFDYCHRDLGVLPLCVTQVIKKNNQLFYKNKAGQEIQIKRIYNRVIFDELDQRPDLKLNFSFTDTLEVEWAGHPNWFFRISKFILPYLKGKYFIETTLLSDLKNIPEDLEN
ncbi:MAG: hypothetical protein QG594_1527, partial [Bacteroidota bacterium]|nr:hypothetical protein [Bacteroidota bacterium]